MSTGSAASLANAAQAWEPVLRQAGAQGQQIGEQILSVAHLVAVESLSGPFTDPGRAPDDKAALVVRVLGEQVDPRVVELVCALVRGRWSKPDHLVTALHDLGIQAVLSGARSGDNLDAVQAEVFSVLNLLEDNRELRLALEPSKRTTTEHRSALAHRVLAPSLSSPAMSLVDWCVRHPAEGGVPRNLRRVVELAAAMQQRTIVDVTSAVPLSVEQQARLGRVLEQRLGTYVELNLVVDPQVIGGVKVSVRDLVIDSTMRSSIAGLRNQLVG